VSPWRRGWWLTILLVLVGAAGSLWLINMGPAGMGPDDHADGHDEDATQRGPHGGMLVTDGGFALEVVIYERGVPPEFRVYGYDNGRPLAPDDYSVGVTLERLDGTDRFEFAPQADFQRGRGIVREPHSFDVTVRAEHAGRRHEWSYENHEGRTTIPWKVAEASGISTTVAGPATLVETARLTGTVQADPARLAQVRPRFAGIVRAVGAEIGDRVRAGDVMATVESNDSLQRFDVAAPIDGLVLSRHIQVGQVVGEQPLFQLIDISRVWVQLDVFGRDLARVREGQPAAIETIDGFQVSGNIDWLSPLVTHGSQSTRARVVLPNPQGALRPGQFVAADVVVDRHEVPLAVRRGALQTFRDFDVVFARYGDVYEVRMLELGHRDSEFVEVLGGLDAGVEYVTDNSYLIKADIEKSGASHDH
jgi:cobalt-zinc-cadmium efflux system membrane fusion protein